MVAAIIQIKDHDIYHDVGVQDIEPLHLFTRVLCAFILIPIAVCALVADVWASGTIPPATTTSATAERVAAVDVRIVAAPRHRADWEAMARGLIRIPAGVQWDPDLLDESKAALAASECFREIEVSHELRADGRRLIFELIPYHRIKAIHIEGQDELLIDEIYKVLRLNVGGPLVEDKLSQQAELIRDLYLREGYIDPHAGVTAEIDPADDRAILNIAIQAGSYYRWQSLQFTGNRAFGEKHLMARMDSWDPFFALSGRKRFVAKKMNADLRKLLEFYRDKGYADAKLTAELKPEPDKQRMAVEVTVEEGPRYIVTFQGNQAIKARTLKQDLVLFTQGNRRNAGLRKSVRKIRNRYRAAGFANVKVTLDPAAKEIPPKGDHPVAIIISEGARTLVAAVIIQGNRALPTPVLQAAMATRPPSWRHSGAFVPAVLQDDLAQLRALYLEEGYRDVQINAQRDFDAQGRQVTVGVDIDEGRPVQVTALHFTGLTALEAGQAQTALELQPDTPFREHLISRDEQTLMALIAEKGHPHVKVKGRAAMDPSGRGVTLTYEINEGISVTLGQIYYLGNQRTRARRLAQVVGLTPGEPFALSQVVAAKRELVAVKVWDSVTLTPIGLREQWERVDLFVQLEERKPYYVEIGGGYESDRGFFGELTGGDRNLWGLGQHGWVTAQISQIGYEGKMAVRHPRFWGSSFNLEAGGYMERTEEFNLDFGTEVWGLYGGIDGELWRYFNVGCHLAFEHRDQFSTVTEETSQPRKLFTVAPFITFDLRDSAIRPRKGIYSHLQLDFSNGFDNSLDDFTKLRWDLRGYLTPWRRLTLAALGRVGYIEPWGDSTVVPEDQVFYLGGIRDVRGFEENLLWRDEEDNALGGQQAVAGSLEARFDLGRNLETTLFYDVGQVRRDAQTNSGSSQWRESVGLGLWYHTPVGPIGVLYGHKLDRRSGEDSGQFHFSIGYTF